MFLGIKAYTFLGLNAVRALSIVTLLLVFASSIGVMVDDVNAVRRGTVTPEGTLTDAAGNEFEFECDYFEDSTVPVQAAGVFFAILNRLFIIGQCIILILSELGWPESFFVNYLPVLGPSYGVGILGAMQVFLGAAVLSHHVPTFALVSAFFLFSIGILNILLGLILRASLKEKRLLLSWKNKTPALPTHVERAATVVSVATDAFSHFSSKKSEAADEKAAQGYGYGFGRMAEKTAEQKGFFISKPMETLPKYVPKPLRMGSDRASSPDRI
ncbi:hypothetical protein RhiJN_10856 [Ceratobasidium sp. AG-Ba]|nr:hypothetical protein RhiJN_10856 [Ceratobasidium sp. AG-Ba]QRW11590.1 hypothetical protein RhiLY_10589 [Ceratobasidium sp. AG-Ba]